LSEYSARPDFAVSTLYHSWQSIYAKKLHVDNWLLQITSFTNHNQRDSSYMYLTSHQTNGHL